VIRVRSYWKFGGWSVNRPALLGLAVGDVALTGVSPTLFMTLMFLILGNVGWAVERLAMDAITETAINGQSFVLILACALLANVSLLIACFVGFVTGSVRFVTFLWLTVRIYLASSNPVLLIA